MEVMLQPEVGGRVTWQSKELVPGGRFGEDQAILKVDDRDYKLAVESARSQVRRARLDYTLERRRGEVAKREWNSFGEIDATEFLPMIRAVDRSVSPTKKSHMAWLLPC